MIDICNEDIIAIESVINLNSYNCDMLNTKFCNYNCKILKKIHGNYTIEGRLKFAKKIKLQYILENVK